MRNPLPKLDNITQKIEALQAEKLKIEQNIVQQLIVLLEQQVDIHQDFYALLGGVQHITHTLKTDKKTREAWQVAGEKFLSRSQKTDEKKTSKPGADESLTGTTK